MADARDLCLPRHLGAGLLLGLIGGLGLAACFIEGAPPASFRFQCSADLDCDTEEVCANGLCQQPCGGDKNAACPQEAPVCLNGYCASVCQLADDICPAPQSCVGLTVPGEDPGESGLCVVPCDDQNPCPDADLCLEEFGGLCVTPCASTEDCGSSEECVMGICLPSDSGGGGFP